MGKSLNMNFVNCALLVVVLVLVVMCCMNKSNEGFRRGRKKSAGRRKKSAGRRKKGAFAPLSFSKCEGGPTSNKWLNNRCLVKNRRCINRASKMNRSPGKRAGWLKNCKSAGWESKRNMLKGDWKTVMNKRQLF